MNASVKSSCLKYTDKAPNPPDKVDWSLKYTSNVSDQGSCGASWAFSAAGALESLYTIKKGVRTVFAAQQLLDCSDSYGNEGCNGGLMDQAFWYVIDHGITSDDYYTYTGQVMSINTKDQKCSYKETMKVYQNTECAEVPSEDFDSLQSAVIQQPVSAAISATSDPKFKFYKEGVYDGPCTSDIDAGVITYDKLDPNSWLWQE